MRNLKNTSTEQAEKSGWLVLKPLNCEVVGKAIFEEKVDDDGMPLPAGKGMSIMKSTKRFKVPGGWMYNTSIEIYLNGRVSIAEALAFVPDAAERKSKGRR